MRARALEERLWSGRPRVGAAPAVFFTLLQTVFLTVRIQIVLNTMSFNSSGRKDVKLAFTICLTHSLRISIFEQSSIRSTQRKLYILLQLVMLAVTVERLHPLGTYSLSCKTQNIELRSLSVSSLVVDLHDLVSEVCHCCERSIIFVEFEDIGWPRYNYIVVVSHVISLVTHDVSLDRIATHILLLEGARDIYRVATDIKLIDTILITIADK